MVDEEGIETVYQYNRDRLVEKVAYAGIGQMCLEYDQKRKLLYHYDVLNRMLEAKFADGNEIRLTYKTIMRNPIYFHHDLSMVFQKVFVIKGNIPDNDKSVCDNAEFAGIIFCLLYRNNLCNLSTNII